MARMINYAQAVADRGRICHVVEFQLNQYGFAIWGSVQEQAGVTRQGMGWYFRAHANEYAYYYVRKYTADNFWIDRIIYRTHDNPYEVSVKVSQTLGILTRKPRPYTVQ